ncbi:FxsB family cyclophane-forming radical SAM/SPASM peptide maturase [Actinomadura nitritigenes]|uniref:FxsB family cyclophane-forming radical SAM/SPASM peptide maturase n=1 Tax=Actinomadura nitritigenes TaxID=134602 RepID=UPI003D94B180
MTSRSTADQFVVKVHSRCNLACDHCYIYESPDRGWTRRPHAMPEDVMAALVERLAEHALRHRLPVTTVVLHGGEPLLAGVRRLDRLAGGLRAAFARLPGELRLVIQTNGLLLDEAFLEMFRAHGVVVGVSLDGDRDAHDRHRRFRNGDGSHAHVMRTLELLRSPRYRHLYGGLLCTVDLANPPVPTYEALLDHEPRQIDFLLPHGTWGRPPPGLPSDGAPYAAWLIEVFDRWYGAPRRETGVRLLDAVVDRCLGGSGESEMFGVGADRVVVVETDGAIEDHDAMKAAYAGAASTGRDVMRHGFDEPFAARPAPALCDRCTACPVVAVCGGGLPAHRHHPATGFTNPSVYCRDLRTLIEHVHRRVRADLDGMRR